MNDPKSESYSSQFYDLTLDNIFKLMKYYLFLLCQLNVHSFAFFNDDLFCRYKTNHSLGNLVYKPLLIVILEEVYLLKEKTYRFR